MFEAMAAAQQSIFIEMYIFADDTQITHDFLGLLKDKARAGLEVVIIADAYGSASLRNSAVDELRSAGAEFIFFSHWLRHTHRKILIVDNAVAFIGGVNIEEKIRHWRDLQIRLQGRIVRPLLKSFAYTYEMAGGKKENILQYRRLPLIKKIKSWITDNLTDADKTYHLSGYYRKKIIAAQTSILIVTPYLLPPRWLIALLDDACRRGVKVEVLIPRDTDVKPLNKINYWNACRLADYGAEIYLMPSMNHAKIMLIDQEEGVIGSQNIDILSFRLNVEAGVFFRQKDLVNDLQHLVTEWKKEATLLTSTPDKIKWFDKILIRILKIFYPIF
ncbi:MAG: Phospholipase D/Transphosphatidylase [Candidatus Falkowbacteria bacterium GW2011_GWF2_43_32]|nr:MAG: Phospholipase D/Transphosphatidylase [Candidatus Falkowbacteria bacterium GW2011_GWF2_43_32]